MHWLKLSLPMLHKPEFRACGPVERATWLCLLAHCAEVENGGRIGACASWGDRMWMSTVSITRAEARQECPLWRWEGDDLIVWGYCTREEEIIRRKRAGGAAGGKESGKSRRRSPSRTPRTDKTRREEIRGGGEEEEETHPNVPRETSNTSEPPPPPPPTSDSVALRWGHFVSYLAFEPHEESALRAHWESHPLLCMNAVLQCRSERRAKQLPLAVRRSDFDRTIDAMIRRQRARDDE